MSNPELPKFIDFKYLPDHEYIPGCLSLVYRYEKWLGNEKEGGFTFQFLKGKLFFLIHPTDVQLPIGVAANVEDAVELAKQFLNKWLSEDPKHAEFRIHVSGEILRLEEAKGKEKDQESKKNYEQNLRFLTKTLEELWKNKKK